MKTLFKSALFLALSVGIFASITATAWSQNSGGYSANALPDAWGPDVVQSFPIDTSASPTDIPTRPENTSSYPTENFSDMTFEQNVVTDDCIIPEVKNADFFGVDPDECCDEWEGMGCGKSPKYNYSCGGLKANKGHLGIFWLKRRYGGDGCDYCKGGKCERDCGKKLCDLMKCCPIKNCLKKFCCKDSKDDAADVCDESEQETIFGRPVKSNCRRCGCRAEECSPREGCQSCN